MDAIALYDNISARLVNHKRPKFLPPNLIPADLETAFKHLEQAEIVRITHEMGCCIFYDMYYDVHVYVM